MWCVCGAQSAPHTLLEGVGAGCAGPDPKAPIFAGRLPRKASQSKDTRQSKIGEALAERALEFSFQLVAYSAKFALSAVTGGKDNTEGCHHQGQQMRPRIARVIVVCLPFIWFLRCHGGSDLALDCI